MKRAKQREQAFILVFENLFNDESSNEAMELFSENIEELGDYSKELYVGVRDNLSEIDEIISTYSNGWKLNRISKVNLSVLRLAVYELKYREDVPQSVAINEAVELAKTYATQADAAFVNGVLGAYVRSL